MRTFAFFPGFRSRYGRTELRRLYEFHWMIGFVIAAVLHVVVLNLIPIKFVTTGIPPTIPPPPLKVKRYVPPPIIKVADRPGSISPGKRGIPVSSPAPVDETLETYQQFEPQNGSPIDDGVGGVGGEGGDVGVDVGGNPELDIPVEIHLVEKEPQVVRTEKPVYPPLAVKAGIEGTVWVKILVDKEGHPSKTQLIKSTHEIFEEPALAAAKRFLFTPAYMTGGPVYVWISLPFRFTLK